MENFSLFNLLRALGGADGGSADDCDGTVLHAKNTADRGAGHDGGNTPPPPRDGQANVLAAVLERHEKISNRIKNSPRRPPHG